MPQIQKAAKMIPSAIGKHVDLSLDDRNIAYFAVSEFFPANKLIFI
jgi:hypothetical protein